MVQTLTSYGISASVTSHNFFAEGNFRRHSVQLQRRNRGPGRERDSPNVSQQVRGDSKLGLTLLDSWSGNLQGIMVRDARSGCAPWGCSAQATWPHAKVLLPCCILCPQYFFSKKRPHHPEEHCSKGIKYPRRCNIYCTWTFSFPAPFPSLAHLQSCGLGPWRSVLNHQALNLRSGPL